MRRHDILKLVASLLSLPCEDLYIGLFCHNLALSLLSVHEVMLLKGVQ